MRRAFATLLLAGALCAGAAVAQDAPPRLTADGAALPPITVAPGAPAAYRIDPGGDVVVSAHVLLRPVGGGETLARDRDGFWAPWRGGAMPPAAVVAEPDALVFKLFATAPPLPTRQYRLGLAYATAEGLKHGWADLTIEDAAETQP